MCTNNDKHCAGVLHSALRTSQYQNDAHHKNHVVRVAFSIGVEAQIG